MSVNPNSATESSVRFRTPPSGSCWTPAQLQELATLLVVKQPTNAPAAPIAISSDNNNLATLDAANALLVPGILVYSGNNTAPGGDSSPIIFSGWSSSIDATTAFLEIVMFVDATEPGVQTSTGSTVFIRPNYEVVERTAQIIRVRVFHATKPVTISLRLAQLPIPPSQT